MCGSEQALAIILFATGGDSWTAPDQCYSILPSSREEDIVHQEVQ